MSMGTCTLLYYSLRLLVIRTISKITHPYWPTRIAFPLKYLITLNNGRAIKETQCDHTIDPIDKCITYLLTAKFAVITHTHRTIFNLDKNESSTIVWPVVIAKRYEVVASTATAKALTIRKMLFEQ